MKFKIVERRCGTTFFYELYYRKGFKWKSLGFSPNPERSKQLARDWVRRTRQDYTYEVFTL